MVNGRNRIADSSDGFGDDVHGCSKVCGDDHVIIDGKDIVEIEDGSCFGTDEHGLRSDGTFHISGWLGCVTVVDDEDLPGFEVDECGEEDSFEDFHVGVVTGDDEGG